MPLITLFQASWVYGSTPTPQQHRDLNECLEKFQINTPQRIRHFLAQTAHESNGLLWLTELDSGDDYEYRDDLGNFQKGDGRRFKGAGAIQVTGRFNYQLFSAWVGDRDVMLGADYVAATYPFAISGWFWMRNKLNQDCDRGATVRQITEIVNPGLRGLKERETYYRKALEVI